MSAPTIAEIGDQIIQLQRNMGLENPRFFRPGITNQNERANDLFDKIPDPCELRELFGWRNGMLGDGIPMAKLWLTPGFFMLSVEESMADNKYCSEKLPDWNKEWYPIFSTGAAEMYFCDLDRMVEGRLPVFCYDSEGEVVVSQIYDSITSMLKSSLESYLRRAYFVNDNGILKKDMAREYAIAVELNPNSDYWRRTDLF